MQLLQEKNSICIAQCVYNILSQREPPWKRIVFVHEVIQVVVAHDL